MDASTIEHAQRFLGETVGFWVQTGALLISAIGAIWLIYSSRQNEKRRGMIEMVIHEKQDGELKLAKRHIRELHEQGTTNFAKFLEDRKSVDYQQILRVLNQYEFIACGIHEGALDEKIYKHMQYSLFMRDWRALCGFITELRRIKQQETIFQEFEWLAKRWEREPLRKHE